MATIVELRALLAKATPGPWGEWSNADDYADPRVYEVGLMGPLRMYNDGSGGCTNDLVCETTRATYPEGANDANAALIAAMRNSYEALLAVAEKAIAMVEPYPRTMSERDAILRRRVAQDELKFALADFEAGSK